MCCCQSGTLAHRAGLGPGLLIATEFSGHGLGKTLIAIPYDGQHEFETVLRQVIARGPGLERIETQDFSKTPSTCEALR